MLRNRRNEQARTFIPKGLSLTTTTSQPLEALWLRKVEVNLGCSDTPVIVGADNQGALSLSRDNTQNKRSKHIDVKYQFIMDHILSGTIEAKYVPSDKMVADVMTKTERIKHELFVRLMGMQFWGQVEVRDEREWYSELTSPSIR